MSPSLTEGGIMPRVFSGQDGEISVKVGFGGIRRCPAFQFLPYFSNLSKPKLRLTLSFDDPKKQYKMGEVSIDCPNADITNRPKAWTGQVPMGQEFEVELDVITQSGPLDYELAVPLRYVLVSDNLEHTVWRGIKVLNTGKVQSSEDWFMYIVVSLVSVIVTNGISSLLWWRLG